MARQDFRYLAWRQAPFKRVYYHATSRIFLAPMVIIGLILIGAAFYYWNRYSAIIDAGLRGDIFVRSSGIYAAPLNIRDGSGTRMTDVITHLRKLGYQQGGPVANDKRGYYSTRNNALDIYPGSDTRIDGEKAFPNLRITFGRNGLGVQKMVDLDNQQQLGQAQIEPELISSVVNEEREKRKIIEYKDLPKTLVDAITSIEDRQFFEHAGLNLRGIMRALLTDIQAGEIKEGGSSITQQLVKNFFLKPDPTFKRKLSEAYMSVILETRLSKEEIMAMYCNQIYLGQRAGFSINGFGQAARVYFGKDVSLLNLQESALLAGIIQSPNRLSPFTHEEVALNRRNKVLDDMVEADKITRDQAIAAKKAPLGVASSAKSGGVDVADAPYFIDYMTRQVESQYDERDGSLRSLRIYSTIDLQLQQAAYQAVTKRMAEVDKMFSKRKNGVEGLQAALVAMNPKTGEILAMVGGRDYAKSQLNRATEARRQPGSVFKPFVYAAAIGAGGNDTTPPITAATTFIDEPKSFGNYSPSNFGDKFAMGPVTVRDALVQSKNVVTVEVAQSVGLGNVARLAEKAGLTKVPQVMSMSLGVAEATPLQMASAYTSFANRGKRVLPIAVKRVTTKDGSTLVESRSETRDVMSSQVAYIMTSMMQDVLDYGTGTRVRQMGFSGVAAGKTGSSRDAWFVGYTPNIVCVVWAGFDDNSDIKLTGGVVAAPIWADFMTRALRIRPELGGYFEDPGGLVVCEVDPFAAAAPSGGLLGSPQNPTDPATGAAPSNGSSRLRREIFLIGTAPCDAQPLPDGSIPGAEASTGTPGVDPGMIPLPPDAGKNEPRPAGTPNQKWSFGARLKDFLGIGGQTKPTPTPTPTPKPAQESKTSQRRFQGPSQTMTPGTTPTIKPVVFSTARTAGGGAPAVTPRPKPPPNAQVATRPRKVTERKQSEKTVARSLSDSRGNDTKSSAKKPAPKNAEKRPAPKAEIKTVVKQREKSGDQAVKPSKPAPTPTPSPKASPTPAPTPAGANAVPKGEGTFTLEVCPVSGLLPVRGVCKNTARQRFKLGGEPTKFCDQAHHGNK